jgi:tetratricopeptide (TPR) repeat protein
MAVLWILLASGMESFNLQAAETRPGMDQYLDGLEAFDRGAYDEALADFSKAIEKDGNNLEYQYRYGLAYGKLGRDLEAATILKAVLSKDKARYEAAWFDLAEIHSRKKDYAGALTVLDDAEKNVKDTSRVFVEKGIVCLKMKNPDGAEENFRKALALNPDLSQSAYYHIGLALLQKGKTRDARNMFKQAVDVNPKTPIAAAARSAMDNAGAMGRASKPWHVTADFSYAYDDNIPNDPLDAPGLSTSPATDLGDQYQAMGVNAFYTFSLSAKVSLDAGYSMTYLHYNDPDNGNLFGNSPYLNLKYEGGSWAAGLRYGYSYYTEDGSRKLSQNAVFPSLRFDEPFGMQTGINLGYVDKDYLDHGVTPDASQAFVKARQMFKIPDMEIRPYLGFGYGDEDADTDDASYSYYETLAGISAVLPLSIIADLSYTDLRSDYDVSYGGENREDKGFVVTAMLSKGIFDGVVARLFYVYVKNDSNVMTTGLTKNYDPYEYDKNIVKVQVEVNL